MISPNCSPNRLVKQHYQNYIYPKYPLLTSIRPIDSYALNLQSLWARYNLENIDKVIPSSQRKILLAGSGSFSPYPTSIANPTIQIFALDLSSKNLKRARLHCLLHRCFNVCYLEGDLLTLSAQLSAQFPCPLKTPINFPFIDCYGVIHHIQDDVQAIKRLHQLLSPKGFARIMVYSSCARKSIEQLRRIFRIVKIQNISQVKILIKRAKYSRRYYLSSKLLSLIKDNYEATFDSGLADMFLHPYAKTYNIHQLLTLLSNASLYPLEFIHSNALPNINDEINRIEQLEKQQKIRHNYILMVGRKEDQNFREQRHKKRQTNPIKFKTLITLNPILKKYWSPFSLFKTNIQNKMGIINPTIGPLTRIWFFRHFYRPLPKEQIYRFPKLQAQTQIDKIHRYLKCMFLIEYHE